MTKDELIKDSEKFLKSKGLDTFCFVQDHKAPKNHYYVRDLLSEYLESKVRCSFMNRLTNKDLDF